ncbi:hypothetical protein EV360DRAFT_84654 [Lentinula raphanica]|nr:hypothetical protein EV360DRAFT_84654 [Lentinula raphanica]
MPNFLTVYTVGFHTLRSGKAFNPNARPPEVVLVAVNAASLIAKGQRNQQQAYDAEDHDELVPPRVAPYSARRLPQYIKAKPLSGLLAPRPSIPTPLAIFELADAPLAKRQKLDNPCPPALTTGRQRQKARYRQKRRASRVEEQGRLGVLTKAVARRRVAQSDVVGVVPTAYPPAGRWSGRRWPNGKPTIMSSRDVFAVSGLTLYGANDCSGRIWCSNEGHRLMALLPRPQAAGWDDVMNARDHRRGQYATLPTGLGFGGGRTEPGHYANTTHNAKLMGEFLADRAVQLVARFVDAGLQTLFPKLHRFLDNLLEKILDDNPDLKRMFPDCCYGACHVNLTSAWTRQHQDYFNILFAMCCVFCVGDFDSTRGGHLIAWEFGIVTEFPPGSAVFLPSAWVTHANIPIAHHERRSSIAFFMSSGLARWYQNGYMSDKTFQELAMPRQIQVWKDARSKLWEAGLEMLLPS